MLGNRSPIVPVSTRSPSRTQSARLRMHWNHARIFALESVVINKCSGTGVWRVRCMKGRSWENRGLCGSLELFPAERAIDVPSTCHVYYSRGWQLERV